VGALLPVLVLAGRARFQNWLPVGDVATIGLRVAEVGSSHTPLVGPYSHFGWSHPGPLLFELLAIPSRAVGTGSNGLLLGALLVNGASIVIIATRLYRYGGIALASLGVACFGLVSWSLGASWLWYPWNPNLSLLPFAALLVVTWTTARNLDSDPPLLALLASFIAQTHVAYLPFAVVLVPIALVGRVRRVAPEVGTPRLPGPSRRSAVRALTGVILAAAWLPPTIDALAHGGGNVHDLVTFWLGDHPGMGIADAFRIVCLELSPRAPWLGFHEPTFIGAVAPRGFPVPLALIALLAATAVARRTKDRLALRSCLVTLASIGVGTVSIARIVGLAYPYLLFSTRVLGASSWLVAAWTLLRALEHADRARARRIASAVAAVAGIAVIAMLTATSVSAGIGPHAERATSTRLARIIDAVDGSIGDDPGTIRVESEPSFAGSTVKAGLLLHLVERGVAVRTDASDRLRFGTHVANADRADHQLRVTAGSREFEGVGASYRLLAESSPPVPFPTNAPRPRPGEDPHVYLARVKGVVDPDTYEQLVANMTRPFPVAIFGRSRPHR
jgi:hypothetical protein